MPRILDGKKIAQNLKDQLKIEIESIKIKYNRVPGLAVIQVGNVAASSVYVKAKTKAAKEVGIDVVCLLYTSPSPRDISGSRMPSSA